MPRRQGISALHFCSYAKPTHNKLQWHNRTANESAPHETHPAWGQIFKIREHKKIWNSIWNRTEMTSQNTEFVFSLNPMPLLLVICGSNIFLPQILLVVCEYHMFASSNFVSHTFFLSFLLPTCSCSGWAVGSMPSLDTILWSRLYRCNNVVDIHLHVSCFDVWPLCIICAKTLNPRAYSSSAPGWDLCSLHRYRRTGDKQFCFLLSWVIIQSVEHNCIPLEGYIHPDGFLQCIT